MTKQKQIYESGLKVIGYDIVCGREHLENLKVNKSRRYTLDGIVEGHVYTTQGVLYFKTEAGFIFDGRSGPKIIDWYVPNLGTFEERLSWFLHDLLGYAQSLNFKDTNLMLFVLLRDLAKYRYVKAKLVQLAVSISKSWYGEPKPGDWCAKNIGKVTTKWESKKNGKYLFNS